MQCWCLNLPKISKSSCVWFALCRCMESLKISACRLFLWYSGFSVVKPIIKSFEVLQSIVMDKIVDIDPSAWGRLIAAAVSLLIRKYCHGRCAGHVWWFWRICFMAAAKESFSSMKYLVTWCCGSVQGLVIYIWFKNGAEDLMVRKCNSKGMILLPTLPKYQHCLALGDPGVVIEQMGASHNKRQDNLWTYLEILQGT